MQRLLLSLLLLMPLVPAVRAYTDDPEEDIPIQRYLKNLYLGDTLEVIRRIYPPAREWPSYIEPRGQVKRYRVERAYAKKFPRRVQTMWLGMKKGRLVEIKLIYDARYTRKKGADKLAGDLALIYGKPKYTQGKYWWSDGKTVMRIFYEELPILRGADKIGVELRTTLQIMDQGLFKRTD